MFSNIRPNYNLWVNFSYPIDKILQKIISGNCEEKNTLNKIFEHLSSKRPLKKLSNKILQVNNMTLYRRKQFSKMLYLSKALNYSLSDQTVIENTIPIVWLIAIASTKILVKSSDKCFSDFWISVKIPYTRTVITRVRNMKPT